MREQEQRSQSFWDAVADTGEPGGLHGLLSADQRLAVYRDAAEKAVLLDRCRQPFAKGGRLLEVGCGGGRWTVWLASMFDHVYASDISPRMVERARARVEAAGLQNVTVETSSMEALDLQGSFDVGYLGSCLHYMSEEAIDEGLSRLAQHLPTGALLLSRDTVSLIGRTFHRAERYGGDDPAIYRPATWYADAMRRHGFELEDEWPTFVVPVTWRLRKLLPDAMLARGLELELRWARREVAMAPVLHHPTDKDHRFFAYVRR